MKQILTPQKHHWDHFWQNNSKKHAGHVSWSKRRIQKVLVPFVKKGSKVLDAGCGSGFFSKYFSDCGMETVALDYSEEALQMTKSATLGHAQIEKADLTQPGSLNRLNKKFDLIFTDGLFEHFPSEKMDSIMSNLISVLAEDGHVATFVPNRWSPWELIRPLYMPGIEEEPFTLLELCDLNDRNGLHVRQSGGLNTFPFAFSPDRIAGRYFGMLLFTISQLKTSSHVQPSH